MNNYKIIENRPELSSSQIIVGMNFGIVKAGALATKVTIAGIVFSKAIISKGFVAAAVLASSALVYKSYTAGNDTPDKNQSYIEEAVGPQPYRQGSKLQYNGSPHDGTALDTHSVLNTTIKPMQPPNQACQPRQVTPTLGMPNIIPAKESLR